MMFMFVLTLLLFLYIVPEIYGMLGKGYWGSWKGRKRLTMWQKKVFCSVGDEVLAWHKSSNAYYPATIQFISSDSITVTWTDGDQSDRTMMAHLVKQGRHHKTSLACTPLKWQKNESMSESDFDAEKKNFNQLRYDKLVYVTWKLKHFKFNLSDLSIKHILNYYFPNPYKQESFEELKRSGMTVLHMAAKYGNTEAVRSFINAGVDINKLNAWHETPLLVAVCEGSPRTVQLLLDKTKKTNPEYLNIANWQGENAIHRAAACGGTEQRKAERTEQIQARINSRLQIVRMLIGAGVHFRNMSSFTLSTSLQTALHSAASAGNEKIIEFLIDEFNIGQFGIDFQERQGFTPFLIAAEKGSYLAMKMLLSKGANAFATTQLGENAILFAAKNNHPMNLQLLLQYEKEGKKLDMNGANSKGMTPLACAIEKRSFDAVKILVKHGVNINESSIKFRNRHITPLMFPFIKNRPGSEDIVRLLLQSGANINEVTANGETALSFAIKRASMLHWREETFELLLKSGPNVSQLLYFESEMDEHPIKVDGETALGYAIKANIDPDLFKIIVDATANIDARNINGKNALMLAKEEQLEEVNKGRNKGLFYVEEYANEYVDILEKKIQNEQERKRDADPRELDDILALVLDEFDDLDVQEGETDTNVEAAGVEKGEAGVQV